MSGGNQICEKPLTDRKRRDRIFSGFQNFLLRSATLRPVGECRRSSHQLDSVEATARRKKCRLHGRLVQPSEK
jgi:hypothetical protein